MVAYQPDRTDILLTASQSRALDQQAIARGIPGIRLMETAGCGAAEWILKQYADLTAKHAAILCGKGNNGGDGFVVARKLLEAGWHVSVFSIADREHLTADAAINAQRLEETIRTIGRGVFYTRATSDQLSRLSSSSSIYIDAILGTGFSGILSEDIAALFRVIRNSGRPVLALDLPSGLNADTGIASPETLSCAATIAFGTYKKGHVLENGPKLCGELTCIDLGFPDDILSQYQNNDKIIRFDRLLYTPQMRSYKYDGPGVLVVGGSAGMCGAAIMAAKSAWSLNLGAVRTAHPAGLSLAFDVHLPQMAHVPAGSPDNRFFTCEDAETVLQTLRQRNQVLLIGPGLGRNPETIEFVRTILASWAGPAVVDADALHAISGMADPITANPLILTPHPGELRTLSPELGSRDAVISDIQQRFNACILAKGYPCIVQATDSSRYLTGYDTRIFNRAGYGDVLAGLTAGFLAIGGNSESCCIAALLESLLRYQITSSQHNSTEPWVIANYTRSYT